MTQSNRVQLAFVRETTAGVTPDTPRMRTARIKGETLFYRPIFNNGEEINADRMVDDPTQIMFESGGSNDNQLSYPVDNSWLSDVLRSLLESTWSNTNFRDNDGAAASVITGVATTNTVLTVTTGTAFVANELYQFSGFGVAGNNGVFKCTTGGATVPRFVGSGITDEASPPAAARVKNVGLEGDSGDIAATSTGLSSSTLDFTTIAGLAVGKWIKIDSANSGKGFATAVLNDWARITAISAHAITLDNRPAGWTTDAGAGKTIRVYFGDQIKNGLVQTTLTIERGFLGQNTPTYIVNKGMAAGQGTLTIDNRKKVELQVTWTGMGGGESTSTLDASPDAVTTNRIYSAHVNVGRLAEAGSPLAGKNYAKTFTVTINNNLRTIEDLTQSAPVGINDGECTVTGKLMTYFGSDAYLSKFYAGTITSFNSHLRKDSQAVITQLPRITLSGDGSPQATAKNTDVMAGFDFTASRDTLTSAHVLVDRVEFYA